MTTVLCPTSFAELRVDTDAIVWCPRCATHHDREFLMPRDETPCPGCGHRRSAHGRHHDHTYACQLSTCGCRQPKEIPMRYRAKPVVIEAFRFDGTGHSHSAVEDWAEALIAEGKAQRPPDRRDGGTVFTGDSEGLYIGTLEGRMHASPGDYVICGTAGEFYPCKPDIFEAKYEPVAP